jgi:hypothetical protein
MVRHHFSFFQARRVPVFRTRWSRCARRTPRRGRASRGAHGGSNKGKVITAFGASSPFAPVPTEDRLPSLPCSSGRLEGSVWFRERSLLRPAADPVKPGAPSRPTGAVVPRWSSQSRGGCRRRSMLRSRTCCRRWRSSGLTPRMSPRSAIKPAGSTWHLSSGPGAVQHHRQSRNGGPWVTTEPLGAR